MTPMTVSETWLVQFWHVYGHPGNFPVFSDSGKFLKKSYSSVKL